MEYMDVLWKCPRGHLYVLWVGISIQDSATSCCMALVWSLEDRFCPKHALIPCQSDNPHASALVSVHFGLGLLAFG
jgi:hypothetical protein